MSGEGEIYIKNFWYKDTIVYHIYTFSLANVSFMNNYNETGHKLHEIEKWIPHIKKLGCDSILFSPVLKSRSHGYDVTDYLQIDNRIGDNTEFKELVKKFHENGIRVILDSVFNHCGRDFFAFQELRSGNRNYADWFSGVDFNRQSPMGDPFDYDTWSGYYELVKFNLRNNDVKNYLFDAARFWINELDIDGMRLDSANVTDFDFMKSLRQITTDIKPDFWLMGEVVAGDYPRWVNNEHLHSVTNYILFKGLFSSHSQNNLYELEHTIQNAQPYNGLPLYTFLDNHDQPRIASNVDPAHLKTLYTLLYTLPGVPSIYYGSEWGIQGVKENNSDAPMRPYIDIENPPEDKYNLEGFITKLAKIRNNIPALRYGSYRKIYLEYHRPYVFEREYENEKVYIAVNINDTDDSIDLSSHLNNNFIDLISGEKVSNPGCILIKPHFALILAKTEVEISPLKDDFIQTEDENNTVQIAGQPSDIEDITQTVEQLPIESTVQTTEQSLVIENTTQTAEQSLVIENVPQNINKDAANDKTTVNKAKLHEIIDNLSENELKIVYKMFSGFME